MPFDALLAVGRGFGTLLFHLLPARRQVARTNVALAFPGSPAEERERIVRESFRESGAAVAETVCVWFRPAERYTGRFTLEGTEHVDAALAEGRGIVLLQAHFTCIDICAPLITSRWAAGAVYDAPKNPLYAALLAWQRGRWIAPMIDNRDIRTLVRLLRRGGIAWYSPDQSVPRHHGGIATRYFGQPVLTTGGTARLVSMTGAAVIPHVPVRDPSTNRYTLRFLPPLRLPEGDTVAATQAVNDLLERQVREQPGQYLWVHKRFKPPSRELPNPYRREPQAGASTAAGRDDGRGPPLRYRAAARLLAPLLTAHLLVRARRDGGTRYLRERLGLGRSERSSGRGVRPWIHAASVGEVMTVLPLLRAVLGRGAVDTVLVTTNTPTGADVLARHAPEGTRHRYLPIDWPGATRRFLERERPSSGWIVETEIWPWLYARCAAFGVPLSIVNARLSARTLRHVDGPLGPVYRRALAGVEVLARSDADARGYRALGAEAARVRVVGELKFAGGGASDDAASSAAAPAPRLLERPYVLAASTHADEERRLAEAWLATRTDGLLVIVPRHPERGTALARELREPSRCTRRSLGETPPPDARLHLADTLGELDVWYARAAGAFVGGSLVERGGHNVLEPARHGCPIVVGPHTANFADAIAALRSAEAIETADGADAVARFLSRALDGEAALSRQGERARAVSAEAADIVPRYLAALGG